MGIVVSLIMLLGVIALSLNIHWKAGKALAAILFLGGTWNIAWYGLRHLTEFWGIAALASGSLMILAAGQVLKRITAQSLDTQAPKLIGLRGFSIVGLLGFFGLYAMAIIQLNM